MFCGFILAQTRVSPTNIACGTNLQGSIKYLLKISTPINRTDFDAVVLQPIHEGPKVSQTFVTASFIL